MACCHRLANVWETLYELKQPKVKVSTDALSASGQFHLWEYCKAFRSDTLFVVSYAMKKNTSLISLWSLSSCISQTISSLFWVGLRPLNKVWELYHSIRKISTQWKLERFPHSQNSETPERTSRTLPVAELYHNSFWTSPREGRGSSWWPMTKEQSTDLTE